MDKPWWKEVVMYQVYPRSFNDSNGDGIGDLRGIIEKIDHIAGLGVDVIWLGPVYDSPNDDNGYDISDYYKIHPEFGTMDDFDELLEKLHTRGIRLIMDLVVNHSSDEHAWFRESRKSKNSPYRDFYFWKDGTPGKPPNNWQAWFGGSAWTYDDVAEAFYLHLFTQKQPDLNWENPRVRKEVYAMMRFWLDKGIDGFRMDVISLISKKLEFENSPSTNLMYLANHFYANGPRVHEFLQEMSREVLSRYDIMTVGEGPGITKDIANLYIGRSRNELNMIFQLELMFLDNGPGGKFDPQPISLVAFKKLFRQWDQAVGEEGWNNIFLDNHDFPRMVSRFGNDGKYRIPSAQLLATFLLTMRGTPCIYQGSEIGMTNVAFENIRDYRDVETLHYYHEGTGKGLQASDLMENIHMQGRDNARTPMQWTNKPYAGFSDVKPWININPNYPEINVARDQDSGHSIYRYYQALIGIRKEAPTLVHGQFEDLDPHHPELYIYSRSMGETTFYVILNFSDTSQATDNIPREYSVILCNYDNFDPQSLQPWQAVILKKNK